MQAGFCQTCLTTHLIEADDVTGAPRCAYKSHRHVLVHVDEANKGSVYKTLAYLEAYRDALQAAGEYVLTRQDAKRYENYPRSNKPRIPISVTRLQHKYRALDMPLFWHLVGYLLHEQMLERVAVDEPVTLEGAEHVDG